MEVERNKSDNFLKDYIQAGSGSTSPDNLRQLAVHENDKIRLRVAENKAAPKDVLEMLAWDRNPDVVTAVASNKTSPEALVQRIARESDVLVRHGLAQSLETPRRILEILCEDENGWVRGEAIKTLKILDSWKNDELSALRSVRKRRSHQKEVAS